MLLAAGTGIGSLCRNRPPNWVFLMEELPLVFRQLDCTSKTLDEYEVMVCAGYVQGYSKNLVVIGCYIPPNYPVASGRGCFVHIKDLVIEIKRAYCDPLIVVSGDFNQWEVRHTLQEFPDLKKVVVGPTRRTHAKTKFSPISGGRSLTWDPFPVGGQAWQSRNKKQSSHDIHQGKPPKIALFRMDLLQLQILQT